MQIKSLVANVEESKKQAMLLKNYQKEYILELYKKQKIGLDISSWNNYNKFLYLLSSIINDNNKKIFDLSKNIKKELEVWWKYKLNLKTWQYLNKKNKDKIIKAKKIREQKIFDEYVQLKMLKLGC